MLAKSIKIKIEENDYIVKFPTVGQLLEIENMRMALTNNAYGDLARARVRSSNFIVDLVDAISTFFVLIPELRSDLTVKSYTELDPLKAKMIIKVYMKQFYPWFGEWLTELYRDDEDLKEKANDDESIGEDNE